jgi:5-methylcytosine-specific restriction endonuclease McrA
MRGEHTVNLWNDADYRKSQSIARTKLQINSDSLKTEYLSGKTIYELSEAYNCSPCSVWKRLKILKIKMRGNAFKKGHVPYKSFLGKKHTDIAKEQIRQSKLQEKNNNWKGGVTKKECALRMTSKYNDWRKTIYKRDGYKCMECNSIGKNLEAHHIKSFAMFPEKRFHINNGITLCHTCHMKTKTKENLFEERYMKMINNKEVVLSWE